MTTFFFDNTFSPRFPRMLATLGVETKALRDEFPVDARDVIWLPRLQSTGWILVTGDMHIRTRPAEIVALVASGVTALFVFGPFSGWMMWRQAAWLVTHWPTIEAFVRQSQQGTLATILQSGAAQVYTPRQS